MLELSATVMFLQRREYGEEGQYLRERRRGFEMHGRKWENTIVEYMSKEGTRGQTSQGERK